jgi:hypothetical protein
VWFSSEYIISIIHAVINDCVPIRVSPLSQKKLWWSLSGSPLDYLYLIFPNFAWENKQILHDKKDYKSKDGARGKNHLDSQLSASSS